MGLPREPRRLSPRGIRLLKLIHVVAASSWLGGTLVAVLALLRVQHLPHDVSSYADTIALIDYIDTVVFIPAGVVLPATGAIYGACTKWGFLRHWWVAAKWVLTILVIALGFVYYFTGITFVVLQLALIVVIVVLSVYKPRPPRHARLRTGVA